MTDLVKQGSGHSSVTGVQFGPEQDGVIELAVPNLLPTDNASEVIEVAIKRIKIPVRITSINIEAVDNGFIVRLPQAGRQNPYGPDGAHHVFADKKSMLEFIALVIGQVTYQYREINHSTELDRPSVSVI